MEAFPLIMARSKRGYPTGDDREKKRFRESPPQGTVSTTSAFGDTDAVEGDWTELVDSKQTRPRVLKTGASNTGITDQPEANLIQDPPLKHGHLASSSLEAHNNVERSARVFNHLKLDNSSQLLDGIGRPVETHQQSTDMLMVQASSSASMQIKGSGNWLFNILMIMCCCCATAFFQLSPSDVRTFQHVIPPKHALDVARKGGNVDRDLLESFLSNRTLRDFLTDPRGFHLGMAVRKV